jgi:hypothetical protein
MVHNTIDAENLDVIISAQPQVTETSVKAEKAGEFEHEKTNSVDQKGGTRFLSKEFCLEIYIGSCSFRIKPCDCPIDGNGCDGAICCLACMPVACFSGIILVSFLCCYVLTF